MSSSSLGNDLASIRHRRGMSMEDIQKATRIPPHILEAIEDDSIYSLLSYSPTYMRSYMRSYAKALGIKEQDIVQALDQVEAGTYDGGIDDQDDSNESDEDLDDTTHEPAPDEQKDLFIKKKKPYGPKPFLPADYSSIDWADVGHKAQIPKSKSRLWQIIIAIFILVAIIIGIYLLYNYYSPNSERTSDKASSEAILKPQAPSDSLKKSLLNKDSKAVAQSPAASKRQRTLPDTLVLAIYAAYGKLEPVRVYTDITNKRNPYWISKGNTLSFPFVNTLRIRAVNQYNRMQLLFNGHEIKDFYKKFYNTETNMVELKRSTFKQNPQWLTSAR